jgi:serine protease Do
MPRLAMTLFVGLCAYVGGLTSTWLFSGGSSAVAQNASPEQFGSLEPLRLSERFEQVARKVSPAVVAIEAVKPTIKDGKNRSMDDSGSGVLVKIPGRSGVFALTNNHVIGKADPSRITVNLADGRLLKPTRVWTDPETDIALLKLAEDLVVPTVQLGDSARMRVGQWVLAFGSPFGLNQTVTHGIISARERGQVSLGSTIRIKEFLQTDAAINPGSSGGPLVNLEGEVIGINTAIASPSGSNSGIAFSIPANLIKKITGQLLDHGKVQRGYLGVQLSPGFESSEATRLGLNSVQGALVDEVHADTPAAQAGLQRSDVILELDGIPLRNENDFINRISNLPPGQKVRLKIWRNKTAREIEAVVGDWNQAETRFKR